jgi:hypothetical protein
LQLVCSNRPTRMVPTLGKLWRRFLAQLGQYLSLIMARVLAV